jgi:SAM-dependent methyltransferase
MPPRIARYDEAKYYGFGLRLGVGNLLRNGLRLGARKTLGKILQPINSYTRFPEYHFVGAHIEHYLKGLSAERPVRILDVGSPKCFGLYLAYTFDVEIHLTDVYKPAVEEAEVLWNAIKKQAKGEAVFSVQDVRSLTYSTEDFDIVYSMSVIEHVGGATGDSESIREMMRVLRPGGRLLVTVPFGQKYTEQVRIGLQGSAHETGDGRRYFFQRIYEPTAAEERIIKAAPNATLRRVDTVYGRGGVISKLYKHIGINLRGLLGCFNPLLSVALNESAQGIVAAPGEYGDLHSESDVYGNLVLAWEKASVTSCEQPSASQVNSQVSV